MSGRILVLVLLCACNKYGGSSVDFSADATVIRSELHKEVFTPTVNTNRKLDILLVVDNSGSMMDEQENLAGKLDPLLKEVKDSDWQIAITTTDARDCVTKIITASNKNEFASTIRGLGTDGSGDEIAVWKIIQALQGNCIHDDSGGSEDTILWERALQLQDEGVLFAENDVLRDTQLPPGKSARDVSSCARRQQWLREDSTLAILIVSDEDHNCNKYYMCSLTDLYFYLNSIRTLHATARLYGLLDIDTQDDSMGHGAYSTVVLPGARKFLNWQDNHGESLFDHYASINDKDYTETLQKISRSISAAMQNTFILKHTHDEHKLDIKINYDNNSRVLNANEYTLEDKTLRILSTLPANTSQIEVSYTYNPDKS